MFSSFFGWLVLLCVAGALADDFLTAVGVVSLVGSGFGSSGFAASLVTAAAPLTSVAGGGPGSEGAGGFKSGVVIEVPVGTVDGTLRWVDTK